jgi:hypothetical protein
MAVFVAAIHNGGFGNGCISNRCLHNSKNVSYNYDLVSRLLQRLKMKIIKNRIFSHFLNNVGLVIKGKLISSESVLIRCRYKIHRYV